VEISRGVMSLLVIFIIVIYQSMLIGAFGLNFKQYLALILPVIIFLVLYRWGYVQFNDSKFTFNNCSSGNFISAQWEKR
jgi:hypothetical protein